MKARIALAALLIAAPAGMASAQRQGATETGTVSVDGTVAGRCVAGTNSSGSGSFDLGVLINTSTGLLRNDLVAPPKVLTGAYCSAASTITVSAEPLISVNNIASPPTGFSRTVHYTATAAGWTPTAASFATDAASNPGAVQVRGTAFTGDITVSIGSFSTDGGNSLLLVSDPAYLGTVTVTLAALS